MSMWIAAVGEVFPDGSRTMSEESYDAIRNAFLEGAFSIVDEKEPEPAFEKDLYWGIPVRQTTLIAPVHPRAGDIQSPFRYVHRRDMLAIAGVDVPQDLMAGISTMVTDYHDQNIKA